MRKRLLVGWSALLLALGGPLATAASGPAAAPASAPPVLTTLRQESYGLLVQASAPLAPDFFTLKGPDRFVIDLPQAELADASLAQPFAIGEGGFKQLRLAQKESGVRLVVDLDAPVPPAIVQSPDKKALVVAFPGTSFVALSAALRAATAPLPDWPLPPVAAVPRPPAVPPATPAPAVVMRAAGPRVAAPSPKAAYRPAEPSPAPVAALPSPPALTPLGPLFQALERVSATSTSAHLDLTLEGARALSYTLFQHDRASVDIRLPNGRYQGAMPRYGGGWLKELKATPGRPWVLAARVQPGDYALTETLSPEQDTLTLRWEKLVPRRFADRPLVIVDAGHGGNDPGALGPTGQTEKRVTQAIAAAVAAALAERRINTVMTRSIDAEVHLQPRLDDIERFGAAAFVSIHANSHTNPTVSGLETFYRQPGSRPFAAAIHDRLVTAAKRPDRGVKQERLYVLRHPTIPSALVETGFISHPDEEKLLSSPDYQRAAADAIAEGIAAYLAAPPLAQAPPGGG